MKWQSKSLNRKYIAENNRKTLHGVVVNKLVCNTVVSVFELHSRYCVPFRNNTRGEIMNPAMLCVK